MISHTREKRSLCERRRQCGEQNGEEIDEREVDVGLVGTGTGSFARELKN